MAWQKYTRINFSLLPAPDILDPRTWSGAELAPRTKLPNHSLVADPKDHQGAADDVLKARREQRDCHRLSGPGLLVTSGHPLVPDDLRQLSPVALGCTSNTKDTS